MSQTILIATAPVGTVGTVGTVVTNDEIRRRLLMVAPAMVIAAAILYLRLIQ